MVPREQMEQVSTNGAFSLLERFYQRLYCPKDKRSPGTVAGNKTISGVLLDTDNESVSGKNLKHSKNRIERAVGYLRNEKWSVNHTVHHLQTYPVVPHDLGVQPLESATLSVTQSATLQARSCGTF
ncbi:hypothetical protein HF086_001356 [Spodoptera exigua]|uniref:Uncharacterized protein n=1 Tax=Spodoptera exigua TaxID=7107 RepID=A0A922MCJ4_SPOEX|nr:hypothetical protein HF086_001356 [Spodoptera exigua]